MRVPCRLLIIWLVVAAWGMPLQAALAATVRLYGTVRNADGTPQAGARVQVYDSVRVKRPADFTSPPTGKDGKYSVLMPAGTYWAVAVYRQNGAALGPLQLEDAHSGEPIRLEMTSLQEKKVDFTVQNLRQAARQHKKRSDVLVRIAGRIVDQRQRPVTAAYVLADQRQRRHGLPAYVSTWTGSDGRFAIYLPRGDYFFGTAVSYPPDETVELPVHRVLTGDIVDLELRYPAAAEGAQGKRQ